jgi:hypothetical protein
MLVPHRQAMAVSQEVNVKEDIKAAIEKAAKEYGARADTAKQQRDKELIERQQFEAGYRRKKDDVILPALEALAKILEPHEWTCKISDVEAASTKFEASRGNMKGASAARPYISFSADAGLMRITIYTVTQTQVVPKTTCLLAELNEDLVDKHLLSFFEKLASEPLDADSTASKLAR